MGEVKSFTDDVEQRKWENAQKLLKDLGSLFNDSCLDLIQSAMDTCEKQKLNLGITIDYNEKDNEFIVKTTGNMSKTIGKITRIGNVSGAQMSFLNPST